MVLSGGGAFAAYEVGVLKALMTGKAPFTRNRRIDPDIVTGTSAGSYNGAMLVSRWAMDPLDAIADIERVWLEDLAENECGNGVFRWRGNPFNFFDVRCFLQNPPRFFWQRVEDVAFATRNFAVRLGGLVSSSGPLEMRLMDLLNFSNLISTHPFPELIRRTVDFEALRRSDIAFQAITTDWATGQLREFHKEDLDEQRGPLIIMASSAIPGLFPPVDIPPSIFVDGGLLMNTPLSPAIAAGATDIHVVYVDPRVEEIPLPEMQTTMSAMQRMLYIMWADTVERDIREAARINGVIERWLRGERPAGAAAGPAIGHTAETLQDLERGRRLRRVSIHRYRPRQLLGSILGMLDFAADQSRDLIARGFVDAVEHDCVREGCVLPAGGPDESEEDEP
jgi:predicted acylesterase/phospholipase RssA